MSSKGPGSLHARLAKPNTQGDMTNMTTRPGIFMRSPAGRLAGALTLVLPIFWSPRASERALNSTPVYICVGLYVLIIFSRLAIIQNHQK